jgi:hypothetical protein
MRALSTVGYIAALFVTGDVIPGYGGGVFAVFTAFRALGAWGLPALK